MLVAGCPRCPDPLTEADGSWTCDTHGRVVPLWRPRAAAYDAFGEHLAQAAGMPTYLPWPLGPGWHVADFGVVAEPGGRARATVTHLAGSSVQDGAVEVSVVSEEPGTGLGARCAGTVQSDPGAEIARTTPTVKVRLDSLNVPLWPVSVDAGETLDRSVVAGEAEGRWLWLVLRPASAVLLLTDEWQLADVSGFGPQLLELPFGGAPPAW